MALFPQFPFCNLHELNLDWIIQQISQIQGDGFVISVNGLSGRVTLYTDKDVVFPDRAFDSDWEIYRRIDQKLAGLKFTGEKFYYIVKNLEDENFTEYEVYTSDNQPPYPVTSVNGMTGDPILAGDNIPFNIDGSTTIEQVILPMQEAIGPVIVYNTCSMAVTAGEYVYVTLSGISGKPDGLYKAVNNKSAGSVWTSADLQAVPGGLGVKLASAENQITTLFEQIGNILNVKDGGIIDGNKTLYEQSIEYVPQGTAGIVIFRCDGRKPSDFTNYYYGNIVIYAAYYYRVAVLMTGDKIYCNRGITSFEPDKWYLYTGTSVTM